MKKYITGIAAAAIAAASSVNAMADVTNSAYFIDVTTENYGWAAEYIDYIAKNGIAMGVGSDMFAPGSNIERGDFAVLLNNTFTFKTARLATYALKDVDDDDYYAQAIANCYGAGVVSDVGLFYPENDITRIDAILMIYKSLSYSGYISGSASTDVSMFTDGSQLTTVERQMAVATLYSIGLISGDNTGALNPNNTMTRAEMAVVFAKLDQYIEEYTADAAVKAEEKAQQDAEEAAAKEAEEQEEAKVSESGDRSGETISEQVAAVSGGTITVDSCTVSVSGSSAISADNGSEINIIGSTVKSTDGNAVEAMNNSVVSISKGTATATNGNAVSAQSGSTVTVDGTALKANGSTAQYAAYVADAELSLENAELTAADNKGAVYAGSGAVLDISNSTLTASTGTGKSSYAGTVDIISAADDREEIVINVENSTINNSRGAAFYLRESDAVINIDGSNTINAATLIYSPEISKNKQEYGNDIELNLTDGALIQNTQIILDTMTILNININDDCYLGGQINDDLNGYVNLYLSQNGTLELNSDLYLDGFINEADLDFYNIIDNGYNIYYNELNSDNDWLDLKEYELLLGGRLVPYTRESLTR